MRVPLRWSEATWCTKTRVPRERQPETGLEEVGDSMTASANRFEWQSY